MADPYEYTDSILKRWGPGGTAYEGERKPQPPAPTNLNEKIASLQRELEQLDALRHKPYGTPMSSSASPLAQPEGSPKTSQQIELENELAELLRSQGSARTEQADRAAFKGRVKRGDQQGLEIEQTASEQTSTAVEDVLTPPPDPLAPARDRGVRLDDLLAFTWPGTQEPYVSANLAQLLRIAATRVDAEQVLRPRHVLDVLLHEQTGRSLPGGRPSSFLPRMRDLLREAGASDTELGHFEFPPEETISTSAIKVVIGPELVAILLCASSLRVRTNALYHEAGVRHFLAALLLEEIGRTAIDAARLTRQSFAVVRDIVASVIEEEAPHYGDVGDDPKSWLLVVAEMRRVSPPRRSAGETHAFASDRTDLDLLGTRSDAAALADLLLLEDLAPPVAVGVFGPWGSGKSTLMRFVQDAIIERTAAKGPAAPKVVQINFDAWSHADAENLWASLTAELFEQIADTIDSREPDGKLKAGLITEIAQRLRKDAEALPPAAATVETQRAVVQTAETELGRLEHEPVAATVAAKMAVDLINAATPKLLSEDDKKSPNKVREAQIAEENKKRLDEMLQAVGVPKGERDPEKLARTLSGLFDLPSRAALLFVLLRRSVRGGLGAALAVPVIVVCGAALFFPKILADIISSLPSLTVLGALLARPRYRYEQLHRSSSLPPTSSPGRRSALLN